MTESSDAFSDVDAVARYAQGPPRLVPGFLDMQRMARLLLAERVPVHGRVLVLGAGGGLELAAFAEAHAGWRFEGIDPSGPMLELARQGSEPFASRIMLRKGYITTASEGPFDGATCILTMHFINREERRRTLEEIRARLGPAAPFVCVHLSVPVEDTDAWMDRYASFAVSSGVDPESVQNAREAMMAQLHVLTPQEDKTMLHEAGFTGVSQFYCGFAFRGWVGYAPD